MDMHRRWLTLALACTLAGCAGIGAEREPLRITPKSEIATSPVVREVLPAPAATAAGAPESQAAPAPAAAAAASAGSAAGAPPSAPASTPASAAPTLGLAAPGAPKPAPPAPPAVPPGTLYVCTANVEGALRQTAIEFEPRVKALCSRHPEMGVCQYEREACRASGGRVLTPAGVEITRQTEAEYDKKVLRVRFRAG